MEKKYFSYNYYLEKNEDLRKFSSKQAWDHYINFGKLEGRKALPLIDYIFNYKYYITIYPDLKDLSEIEAQDHYINNGINEGRIPCDNYTQKIQDYESFENKNSKMNLTREENTDTDKDIEQKVLSENKPREDLKEVYSNFVSSLKSKDENQEGIKKEEKADLQKDPPPIQRDTVIFKNQNGVKVHLFETDKEIKDIEDYVFDYSFYIQKYPDVNHLSHVEAEKHYIEHGKDEGRQGSIEEFDDFDYNYYIRKNPDLTNLNEQEAFTHYLTIGKYEKRSVRVKVNPKSESFDPVFYTESYQDLRNKGLNPRQALGHYLSHGSKEGRVGYKQIINHTTFVTVVIHLFHIQMLKIMTHHINNVKSVFKHVNVIFTVKEGITEEIQKEIKTKNPGCHIIKVINKGTDNLPFFTSIKYIRKNQIKTDFILKLHSKISQKNDADSGDWAQELMYPLTKYWNLVVLQHYFAKMSNIGYVSAQKMVLPKNYDLDFPQNIRGVNDMIKKFPHLEKDWTDFNGGNMFWISMQTLDQYCTDELMDYLTPQFGEGKPPCNLTNKGIFPEYICERLFTGVFCYDKKNIFINTYNQTVRGVGSDGGIINNKYFYQPKLFSINIPKNNILF